MEALRPPNLLTPPARTEPVMGAGGDECLGFVLFPGLYRRGGGIIEGLFR